MTVLKTGRRKVELAKITMDAPLYARPALVGDTLWVVTAERRGWENKLKSSPLELMSLIQFENETMTRRPPTTSWRGALILLRTTLNPKP